jgi:hypothetical protein
VGVHFAEQTPAAIAAAIRRFEALEGGIRPEACRANALRFSAPRFRQEFGRVLDAAMAGTPAGSRATTAAA